MSEETSAGIGGARAALRANRTSVTIIAPLSAALDSLVSVASEQGWMSLHAAMGARTFLLLFLLAVIPDDIYRRIGRRLSGRGNTDDLPTGGGG